MRKLLLSVALLVSMATWTWAQCGSCGACAGSRCVIPSRGHKAVPAFEWKVSRPKGTRLHLFKDGSFVGYYCFKRKAYFRDHRKKPCDPPCAVPPFCGELQKAVEAPCKKCSCGDNCKCCGGCCGKHKRVEEDKAQPALPPVASDPTPEDKAKADPNNFGLIREFVPQPQGNRYYLTKQGETQSISRAKAHALAGSIPDDANNPILTIIGKAADRKAVENDLASSPDLAFLKGAVRIQSFDPDAELVKNYGFKTDGSPTIYYQGKDGSVLHRQDNYDGPQPMATAIRRANDKYQSLRDADLRRSAPVGGSWSMTALAGGAILVALKALGGKR